jgi:tetratricopeptide (TPR) repeat protein
MAQASFDYFGVQRDIFAGFAGDMEAFMRGMAACERMLAEHPRQPQAMVWHGIWTLFLASRNPQQAPALMQKGVAEMNEAASLDPDDLYAFDSQTKAGMLDSIGRHPLGELLQGLGDVYSRQGKPDEAQKYYVMIQAKLPDTEYAKRAAQWMDTRQPLPVAQTACIGCHSVRQ